MEREFLVLRSFLKDESGISLAEVLLASAMASIIATAFLVIFSGFSRNVSLEEERAAALTDVQAGMADLTAELRQAVRLTADGPIVEVLEASGATAELVFHSDRAEDAAGPERYRYFLTGCTVTHCSLSREIKVADSATPPWTYTGAGTTRVVLNDVLRGPGTLFVGADWTTGSEVLTTSCDLTSPCVFDLIKIDVRIDPDPNIAAEEALSIHHEVRLRNAR